MTYYINTFNIPGEKVETRHFAIWQVEPNKEKASHYTSSDWYIWNKEIHDPHKHFKKGYELDPMCDTIAFDNHELIEKIFYMSRLKIIKSKK